ncbi:antitoxin family protein [Acaryochloris sp. IP29b_bin.137]|uniref:antitoxin family protein n=1 Tax=Acaryochloris sp. IP29b_bin.137 TaxID=2969217 RepID=UPI00344F8FCA
MMQTIEAVFDGKVLLPGEPLDLNEGTRVRITVEPIEEPEATAPASFLKTARSLQLEGPSDWSERIDEYLYGENM